MQYDQESRAVSLLRDQVRKLHRKQRRLEELLMQHDQESRTVQHARRDHDMKCTMILEIWRHHRRFREEKELRKVESEEPLQSILYLAFRSRARQKCPDGGKCPMSMTNHAAGIGTCTQKWHDNSELSFLGDASAKNSLTVRNFRAGSWISEEKFCTKACNERR